MRVNSIELQLQIADIITTLEETGGIPRAMLLDYFKFAVGDPVYSNFQKFRETALIRHIFTYYRNKFMDSAMTESICTSKFAAILSNIYTSTEIELDTPQDIYKMLFLYMLRITVDGVAAADVLIQLSELVDKTDNDVLKMEVKRSLLDFYLQYPVKYNIDIKKISQELKKLNAVKANQKELDVKSFL